MPPRKDQTKSVKDVKKTAAKVIEKKAAADPKDKKVRKTASKVAAAPAEQKAPIKEKTPAKATVTKKKIAPAPAAAKPVRATKPATATAKKSQSVPKKEKESNESDKENELTSSKSSSSGKRKREETVEAPEKEKEQEKVAEEAAQVQPKKKVRTVAPTAATRAAINKAPTKVLEVFVFGEGTSGELGLGTVKTDGKKPIDVKRPRLHPGLNNIVQLSCGGMHSIALTANNEILTWGVNDQGALGRDTTWAGGLKDMDDEDSDDEDSDDVGLNPKESTPGKAVLPEGITWVQVAASDSASFALTDAGHVWGWGTFRSNDGILGFKKGRADLVVTQPIWIDDLKKIVEITTGSNHVLARDDKGKVYAWGSGQQCQLGRKPLERDVQSSLIPAGIGSLSTKLSNGRTHKGKPVKLACGSYHSFVIDDKHKVWAWGLNNYAELGLPDEAGSDGGNVLKPTLVESLEDYDIVQVAGGEHHSLACTIDGKLLTWGRIDGNQVGLTPETFTKDNTIFDEHNKPRILKKPTVVPNLPFISFVAAGTDHSLAVSDEGRVYSWGFSANYQTGQGTTDDIKIPTLIDNTAIREKKITWAGAGGQFSILASVKDGQA